jgi:hypothetical protein
MKFSPVILLPAYAFAAPSVSSANAEVPDKVTIQRTTYSGNGCPQGSVSTNISPDRTLVTFGFDKFQAAIGPRAKQDEKQKNCQLHMDLKYPGGFQVSLVTATYHGYARLDQGVTASFFSSYYFSQAAEKTASIRTSISGPEFKNGKTYTKTDKIENASVVWSPCGANGILNVNNRIALTANDNRLQGEITNDDATIKFQNQVRLVWRRCGGSKKFVDTEGEPEAETDAGFEDPAIMQEKLNSSLVVDE